jgi:hypothetical protein
MGNIGYSPPADLDAGHFNNRFVDPARIWYVLLQADGAHIRRYGLT